MNKFTQNFRADGEIRNAINMPSLDASAREAIGPYLDLSSSLGKLLAKLGLSNPDALRVSYHGPLAKKDTALISRTALTSYLESSRSDGLVNIVNAPSIAAEMGLETSESTINAKTEYNELLVIELRKGEERFRLAGTMIGNSTRIVEIDKLYVDINIQGHFLIVRNDDRPGIVGAVGSLLGDAGVNIANLSLARNKTEGNALTVIEVDEPLSQELMTKIREIPGVTCSTGASL